MRSAGCLLILISVLTFQSAAQVQGLDASKIDQVLGRSGQKMGEVYRVGFPRTDLHVVVGGVAIKGQDNWEIFRRLTRWVAHL